MRRLKISGQIERWSSVLLTFALLGSGGGVPAQSKPIPSWALEQRSEFYGKMHLLIGSVGAKFTIDSAGVIIVARPAANIKAAKIVAFKPADKTIFESTVGDWEKKVMHRKAFPVISDKPWRKGGTTKIAGLEATQYFNFTEGKRSSTAERMAALNPAATPKLEMWTTREIKVLPEFADLVAMLTSSPPGTGLPLRSARIGKDGKARLITLDTKSIKNVPCSEADFAIPSGYKKVANYMELLLGTGESLGFETGAAGTAQGGNQVKVVDDEKEWIERGKRVLRHR